MWAVATTRNHDGNLQSHDYGTATRCLPDESSGKATQCISPVNLNRVQLLKPRGFFSFLFLSLFFSSDRSFEWVGSQNPRAVFTKFFVRKIVRTLRGCAVLKYVRYSPKLFVETSCKERAICMRLCCTYRRNTAQKVSKFKRNFPEYAHLRVTEFHGESNSLGKKETNELTTPNAFLPCSPAVFSHPSKKLARQVNKEHWFRMNTPFEPGSRIDSQRVLSTTSSQSTARKSLSGSSDKITSIRSAVATFKFIFKYPIWFSSAFPIIVVTNRSELKKKQFFCVFEFCFFFWCNTDGKHTQKQLTESSRI